MRVLQGHFVGKDVKLSIEEVDVSPNLQADDILVEIKACAVDIQREKVYHQLLSRSLEQCPIGHIISGIVLKTGSNVEKHEEGSIVVGVLPFISPASGCGERCILNQFDVVEKPSHLTHETAAAALNAGLSAYTAVHYLGHVTAGDTVLVLDGATPHGYLTIQLAQSFGAKVLATYRTMAEKQTIENLKSSVAQLIELTQRSTILASAVMEETGGIGVDCIIDNGVRLFTNEEDKELLEEKLTKSVPHKHDLISCLGFAGRWITSNPNLQLDPPDSNQLFLRGASLSFLFPPSWTLMRSQHGHFCHIIKDILDRMEGGEFGFTEITSIQMEKAPEFFSQDDIDHSKSVVIIP